MSRRTSSAGFSLLQHATRLTETADPSLGHDDIVEPHGSSARGRDVVLQPNVVQLQRRAAPELDVQRARQSGRVVALRAIGPSRAVMVLHPVPVRTGLGKPLDEDVILPDFERGPCGRSHVGVEVGVDLDARTPVVLDGEGVLADEGIPPVRAAAARARVHLHPVVVEIEAQVWRGAPHRLQGEGDAVVTDRPRSPPAGWASYSEGCSRCGAASMRLTAGGSTASADDATDLYKR